LGKVDADAGFGGFDAEFGGVSAFGGTQTPGSIFLHPPP
jgi:hypothetical protein